MTTIDKTKKPRRKPPVAAIDLRRKLGLTQTEFWTPLGLTQSAGSRYENGRPVPKPIRVLVPFIYDGAQIKE